jgi:hypothetical protein
MSKTNRLVATIACVALSAELIFAYPTGPDPRHTGAPGDDAQASATSGCHTGTALNGGGGNVLLISEMARLTLPARNKLLPWS